MITILSVVGLVAIAAIVLISFVVSGYNIRANHDIDIIRMILKVRPDLLQDAKVMRILFKNGFDV
jgi:hypothetical protein